MKDYEEKKHSFNPDDVEKRLEEHPDFDRVSGTYILSINSVTLGPKKGIHFLCAKEVFDSFISLLIDGLISFSSVSSEESPITWVPFPGISRETLISKYPPDKNLEIILAASDPNIILIRKISDSGRKLIWDVLDGRIGHGGFTYLPPKMS